MNQDCKAAVEGIGVHVRTPKDIVYITHNVHHVYPIADRFVIPDRGQKLAEVEKKDVKPEDVIETIASGTIVTT